MEKKEVIQSIENFNNLKALVIGDVMIDSYYWGKVKRISPEAPVPIVDVTKKDNRLGGAANVALNLMTLGATPIICSVVGQDDKGTLFEKLLSKRGFTKQGIVFSNKRQTTVKTRIISQGHHLLRVDEENKQPLSLELEDEFLLRINNVLDTNEIDVIIFEDYNKGVLTKRIIDTVIDLAKKKNIPTTVDPKKDNFFAYKNVTLFKPNLKELTEGLKIDIDKRNEQDIIDAVNQLSDKLNCKIAFVTLSELGVIIKTTNSTDIIPAFSRKILDVSGAGDTVISVASLALASGMKAKSIALISNLAGGWVCEKTGVTPINQQDLISEINRLNLNF